MENRNESEKTRENTIFNKGVLELETPMKSADEEITELEYDFSLLTNRDVMKIMNAGGGSMFRISADQAMSLFARAACLTNKNGKLDETDIRTRTGVADAIACAQIGFGFFMRMSQEIFTRIKKA